MWKLIISLMQNCCILLKVMPATLIILLCGYFAWCKCIMRLNTITTLLMKPITICIMLSIYATNWEVTGSIPDEITGTFNWPDPSSCTMALVLTQPLTEMSTRNLPPTSLPSVSWLSRKCGSLDVSQPYRPPQPVIGMAFITLTIAYN
jgi:hypothetical protein